MAITNGYATLAELKGELDPESTITWSTENDNTLELCIEAASRWIDNETYSRFYATTETRYYTAMNNLVLIIDDLITLTTLKTDEDWDGIFEVTWAATDYFLEPRNAALESEPYRQIRVNRGQGDYVFPTNVEYGVEVVGSFGYAATAPTAVKRACLLIANRLFRRKDAIFGVAGNAQLGVEIVQAAIPTDRDVVGLIEKYIRRVYVE